jgi:hypothetical protein
MPNNQFFSDNDTIVKLVFDTFISRNVFTDITFDNSSFGDDNCDDLFPIQANTSTVEIDSLCGIENITALLNSVNLENIYPNPTREVLNLDIFSNNSSMIQIEVLSVTGESVLSDSYQTNRGIQTINLDLASLGNGYYQIFIQSKYNILKKGFAKVN